MNTPVVDAERLERITQAADWFVRVSQDDLSESELAQWLEWCMDARNQQEFQRIRATSEGFDAALPEAAALLDEILERDEGDDAQLEHAERAAAGSAERGSFVREARPVSGSATDEPPRRRATPSDGAARRWWSQPTTFGAIAATLVVAVGAAYLWKLSRVVEPQPVFESGNVNRAATLPDGSDLVLAPRTRVAVEFDGKTRRLALSGGEAYFNVRQDAARPFVVQAGPIGVTALGTAFDVRFEKSSVVVTVQSGKIALDAEPTGTAAAVRWQVTAGNRIVYDLARRDVTLSEVDAEAAADWRQGRLRYFDQPLDAVVEDVSRYTARPITVTDPTLASMRFTGTVFVGSTKDWLEALGNIFPLRAVTHADGSLELVPAPHSRTDR